MHFSVICAVHLANFNFAILQSMFHAGLMNYLMNLSTEQGHKRRRKVNNAQIKYKHRRARTMCRHNRNLQVHITPKCVVMTGRLWLSIEGIACHGRDKVVEFNAHKFLPQPTGAIFCM